jgi:hypothetical protein
MPVKMTAGMYDTVKHNVCCPQKQSVDGLGPPKMCCIEKPVKETAGLGNITPGLLKMYDTKAPRCPAS